MEKTNIKPTVFISSTCNDLSQIREDLKEFLENNYSFNTLLSEFDSFPIEPCIGTFDNCLNNVDKFADIFILIVGTRYGYVTEQGKSITNLEYLHAKAKNIPIFVFISKKIYDNLPIWENNPDSDFSNVTDNIKLFEFVAEIYNEERQWVYTYNSVKDIKQTLQNQFALIFCEGLSYKQLKSLPKYNILTNELTSGAVRALTEKPFAWGFKFFGHVLKDEFNKLKSKKWDLKYGLYDTFYSLTEPIKLLNFISVKFDEIQSIIGMLSVLINSTISDALHSDDNLDLEMLIYTSKRIASMYIKLVDWSLYFRSINADDIFSNILNMLYVLPKTILSEIDNFVDEIYNIMLSIPDIEDDIGRKINITCNISIGNTEEISKEIVYLSNILVNGLTD